MINKEIWCVATAIPSGIDADSIGTKEFATTSLEKKDVGGRLIQISRKQALDTIVEDILDYDDTGLGLGNWLYSRAAGKLERKLNLN